MSGVGYEQELRREAGPRRRHDENDRERGDEDPEHRDAERSQDAPNVHGPRVDGGPGLRRQYADDLSDGVG